MAGETSTTNFDWQELTNFGKKTLKFGMKLKKYMKKRITTEKNAKILVFFKNFKKRQKIWTSVVKPVGLVPHSRRNFQYRKTTAWIEHTETTSTATVLTTEPRGPMEGNSKKVFWRTKQLKEKWIRKGVQKMWWWRINLFDRRTSVFSVRFLFDCSALELFSGLTNR